MANNITSSPPAAEALAGNLAQWRAAVEAELKGVPFEKKLVTRTPEGVALQPLYTRADLAGVAHVQAAPGQAPFVRGASPVGYKAQTWQCAQEIAASDAADFNKAILADLMVGQDSVVIVPDAASRAGIDPDADGAKVGVGGLSLADSRDFATALASVELASIPVHLRAGADALPLAALYIAAAQQRGVDLKKLSGSLTADPLGEWAESGSLPTSLAGAFDALAGWTKWAAANTPNLRTVGVSAQVYGEGGANAVQELALALAAGVEYVRELSKRGLQADAIAAATRFSFVIGPQFFTEVAKFRAFRLLWTRALVAFGAKAEAAAKSAVHARTSNVNKTLFDAHVNMLRVTTEALSAVVGGVDSLHIAPFDEVSGKTDDFSRRIARNVHTLLAEEFHFNETADPAGGSWYIEKLTDELARKAWALFQDIEKQGGLAAALRAGTVQKLVAAAGADKEDAVAKRRSGLIGTNLFPNLKETPLAIRTLDAAALTARANAIVARRSTAPAAVTGDWSAKFKAALAAASKGATVGQLAALAGDTAAEQIAPVASIRIAAGFEALRNASDAYAKRTGSRPKVFLAKMGPVKQHKPRADFSAGFFGVAGFESIAKQAFETAADAAKAAAASGASIAVLCSTDDTYPELVPAFAAAVKQAKPDITVVLAGLPADKAQVDSFKAAGIDEFIHVRANVRELLANLLKKIGAL